MNLLLNTHVFLWSVNGGPLTETAVHQDPFDRLLVAQALTEQMTIVTADSHIPSYPISILW